MSGRASKAHLVVALVCAMGVAGCSPQDDGSAEDAAASSPPAPPVVTTETLPQARQVLPGREVNVPQAGEEVERLAAPVRPPAPPRPVNLGIVTVESANRLATRRGPVTLAGTRGVHPDAVCTLEDGRTPLCTVLARTAVRRFVGQRRVDCLLTVRDDSSLDHDAPCSVGETDLATWIVSQGWAYAREDAGADLLDGQADAQRNNLGLWGLVEAPQ